MSALASQCTQHCSGERNIADSDEICSGVVILGLVLALAQAQERRTTGLNSSSMYSWLIKLPSITTRSVALGCLPPE